MRKSMLVLAATAVAMTAGATAPAAGAATAKVNVRDFSFGPTYTRIEIGDSVRWIQGGSTTHTVTSRAGAPESFSSELQPGQTFTRLFPTEGRYAYHCTVHPEMRGVVQVGRDTVPPTFKRPRFTRGAKSVRVAFGLPEQARVSARLVAAARPGRVLRRAKGRQLDEGRRTVSVGTAGLAAGRYSVTVKAVDRGRNAFTYRMTFSIPAR